jgi:competence protein ComEC
VKRPLVVCALALASGGYAATFGLASSPWLPILILLLGFVAYWYGQRRLTFQFLTLYLVFLAGGALWWQARVGGLPGDPLSRFAVTHPRVACVLEGRVRHADIITADRDYAAFVLTVDSVDAEGVPPNLTGRVYVRWSEPGEPVYIDDRVRVRGELSHVLGHVNPGVYDIEDSLRRRGVHSGIRIKGPGAVERVAPGRWWHAGHWASRLRRYQAQQIRRTVPESVQSFVGAVWLGDRGRVATEEYDAYVRTGTAHILAVSGLHVAIIFVSASYVLGFGIRNPRLRAWATLGVVLAFALRAGARTPLLRASLMVACYLLADFFNRERDAPTALALAAMILMLWNPQLLRDVGFLLSFTSVASILLFSERFGGWFTRNPTLSWIPRPVRKSLATTLAVQLAPFPLAVHFFHVLPFAAPFINLLIIPLLAAALWLTFFTAVAGLVWQPGATVIGHALGPVVWLIRTIAEATASIPFSHLRLTSPALLAMAAYWLALLCWPKAHHKRRVKLQAGLVTACLIGWCIIFWNPVRPTPMVVFLDLGHGDATFIRTTGGETVLVDGGDKNLYNDEGARTVAPFLWTHGVTRLDQVIATHPDRDHVGGLEYILDEFHVGELLLWPQETGHRLEISLLSQCDERGIPVRRLARGDAIELDGARLAVLHPSADWPASSSDNNASLVLRLEWEGPPVLLAGDIERAAEAAIAGPDCRAEVLRVPHHGSNTSSSPAFLAAVRPSAAVVSTGPFLGRPLLDEDVVERYGRAGIPLWSTDDAGAVVLLPDRPLRLRAMRARRGYPCTLTLPQPSAAPIVE